MTPIRVLVADDDAAVRTALVDVLTADGRFVVVGTAGSGREALTAAAATRTDVVLLDVRMPGGGAEGTYALRSMTALGLPPAPLVIAVSADTGASTVAAVLRAGAVGYLTKGRLGALPDLVVRCVEGEVVLAVTSAAEALQRLMDRRQVGSGASLT